MVASLASLSAGCSSVSRFEVPMFGGSSASQAAGPIDSKDFGGGAQPAAYAAVSTPTALRQRGWSIENAPIVEVSATDTAQTLSAGFAVPVSVILEANGLTSADEVRPGQRLIIPTYVRVDNPKPVAKADEVALALPKPAAMGPLGVGESRHIVQDGDTLDRLAGAYRVPAVDIARVNGIAPGTSLAAGTSLRIPAATGTAPTVTASLAPAHQPANVLQAPAAAAAPPAQTLSPPAAEAPAGVAAAPIPVATQPAAPDVKDDGGSGFRWPVRGKIITGFGKQADGARNDGINLAVPAGTPVRAAEEGTVIYAGNELAGYGNLVLVQHKDGWVSAYAHADALKVQRGDKVERGQTIASVGKTGSVDSPQLHFELRRNSKPVDPLPQLSSGAGA